MQEKETEGKDTNAEVRRRRLLQLAEAAGGLDGIAAAAQASAQNLDHIARRRKASGGKKKVISLGDDLARRIEAAFHLKPGWMDWPFPAVPFTAWESLEAEDRGYAQAGLLAAIKERIGEIPVEKFEPATPEDMARFSSSHPGKVKSTQRRRRA